MSTACGSSNGFSPTELTIIRTGGDGIMRVLTIGNRTDSLTLREKSVPMTTEALQSADYALLRHRMLATVQDSLHAGVGIAAPQVGILRQLIAVQRFDKPGDPFELYLNPEIIAHSGQPVFGNEGCLSVDAIYEPVCRSPQITLRYRDELFDEKTEIISGFTAVIFQHEIDHLNGVLFIDRIEDSNESSAQN